MRSKDHSLRIIDLWTFRSTKSNKRYIVEVEGFEDSKIHIVYRFAILEMQSTLFQFPEDLEDDDDD